MNALPFMPAEDDEGQGADGWAPENAFAWEDAVAAIDQRGDAAKLVALLRGAEPPSADEAALVADLLARRVGKDAGAEAARKSLLAQCAAPDVATREAIATLLAVGGLGKPRHRPRRPIYANRTAHEYWLMSAKSDVKALMKERRASGRLISLEDAVDKIAAEAGINPATLRAYALGKHGGLRRRAQRRL